MEGTGMWKSLVAVVAASVAVGSATAQEFTLSSRDFEPGGTLHHAQAYNGSGCAGGNVSPELRWKNAPAGTKSFAVTVYDPDAPTGSGWWHWLVYDIPATVTHLRAGAGDPKKGLAPAGSVQSRNDAGARGYGGPCPPSGDRPHRYVFTVYALRVQKLGVPPTASGATVGSGLNGQALAKATLTARYGR
jgi:Raf kinase inhibitor-like YbhB/YbcL family protein